MHGGAQAVLLERAAETALESEHFHLDSMRVEYLSTPNFQPEVKISKSTTEEDNKVVIHTEMWSRGKLNSTGIFCYSKKTLPPSKL